MRRPRKSINQINVVPYIDVMLVLLVIFMVTAPLVNPGEIELPSVGSKLVAPAAPLELTLRSDGRWWLEDKQLATATTGGPFYLEVDQMLEPAGAGTKLTMHCRGESRGFFKVAEPLVVRLTKRQVEAAGENLKALLEEQAL